MSEKNNGKCLKKKMQNSISTCGELAAKIKIELPQKTEPKPTKKSNNKNPEKILPHDNKNNANDILMHMPCKCCK